MTKKPVILCVDDEKFILDTLLTQLRRRFGDAYVYESAESGEEAVKLIKDLAENNQEVRLVISDQIMPGMKGDELLAYINEQNRETVKILMTGQASLDSAVNAINYADLFRYMTKPWLENDLLLTVDKGLEKYSLQAEMVEQIKIFSCFVPKQFFDALSINSILDVKLGKSVERNMTVMFS
ncbi:MAG: response regulator, partial [Proteobacteria bacterium]|nr:response regulator [Pseudomonadota bacterium]